MKNQTVANMINIEATICHQGGSNASRAGMIIGEKSGNKEANTARSPFGFERTGNNK
jgi:hypothetical protein